MTNKMNGKSEPKQVFRPTDLKMKNAEIFFAIFGIGIFIMGTAYANMILAIIGGLALLGTLAHFTIRYEQHRKLHAEFQRIKKFVDERDEDDAK